MILKLVYTLVMIQLRIEDDMMRKNIIGYILMFLFFFIISFLYCYFISFLNLDEIWNYGFSFNIASGLVPYRDFNMLQMPLFFFISSVFIHVFGSYLWSVQIFNSIIVASMMCIIYKKLGLKGFILYPIILIYSVYSYNIFCLLLGIILINMLDSDYEYKDYVIAFIVSLIFLSKQNIGVCLFIPMIWFSKNKLKSLFVFMIPCLLLLVYLIYYNCVYDFINYTFLGMFDFGKSNGIYDFIIFYVILLGYLCYKLFKSKFKDERLFYVLMFQIVGFPIIDDYHFMIGFILFLYYILMVKNISSRYFKYMFIVSISFFLLYLYDTDVKLVDYDLFEFHLCDKKNSFLYGRKFSLESQKLLEELSSYVISNRDTYGDNIYIFSNWAYMVRLYINDNPTVYDYILDGNMGYKGDVKLIKDVDSKCSHDDCLFIVQCGGLQVNYSIIEYVVTHYHRIDKIKNIDHYASSKKKADYLIYTNS